MPAFLLCRPCLALPNYYRQRDGSGNSASPAVASGNDAPSSTAVQFQHPRAKRKASIESRGKVFRTEYKLAFGLQVVEHDPVSNTPVTANCRFGFNSGCEKRPTASVSGKKRYANSNNNSFKAPRRTNQFEQHFSF
jgi:hypothetical protein